MKVTLASLALAIGANAFPTIPGMTAPLESRARAPGNCRADRPACMKNARKAMTFTDADVDYDPSNPTPEQVVSAARTNCGAQNPTGCGPFIAAAQYVSTSGQYAWAAPRRGQLRGPCPGLNAAANHGYLPRSGVAHISDAILGLGQSYGMSPDLAGFLAAYAVAFDGDILAQSWSIGGPQNYIVPAGLLHAPQGLSYSHNKYEGDASITRCDAYQNAGDAHSLNLVKFTQAWYACTDNSCTLDKWSRDFTKKTLASIATNPMYTAPLFSTTLVSPAAYNFVVNFMSNHSAEQPNGVLTKKNFQTFFSVTGASPDKFKWHPGLERIPDNWYRRPNIPLVTAYTAVAGVFGDLAAEFAAYPKSFKFGGNTGKPNSFVGIDLAEFTNGQFDSSTPTSQEGLSCFFYNFAQQAFPDQLQAGPNGKQANKAAKMLFKYLDIAFGTLANCPKAEKFNDNLFGKYPGYKYNPKGAPGQTC